MARIAVVDDDQDMRQLMRDTLKEHGWDSDVAINQDHPFADLQAQHPDLVILDAWLDISPARWKLLHHLKRKRATRDTPILICMGVPERFAGHADWLRDRDVPVLTTPFDLLELDRVIAAQTEQSATAVSHESMVHG
jgi:DNA-binding response OmpR family regulator